MSIKIALAGNPNSGKTTMFNDLTGSNQYVGNWPGVTVEKKEGKLKGQPEVIVQDLPGIYSLSPYTMEEVITRQYLIAEKPDAIINIVDGSNIERNLYLTTQLVELGIPVVIALNFVDVVRKTGDIIDVKALSAALGCPIIETSASKGEGSEQVAQIAVDLAKNAKHNDNLPHVLDGAVEHAVAHIEEVIKDKVPAGSLRWYAIKLFERDSKVRQELGLTVKDAEDIEKAVHECEHELDDDCESIVTNARYNYIERLMQKSVKKANKGGLTTSDRVDKILTNRILALPIFAAIMFGVYYIAVSTVGDWVTGWTNDVLFGEWIIGGLGGLFEAWGVNEILASLVVDGIVGGVGAVLGFVPQMLVLFIMLAILEECGYMARIAFIMDRIFRRFGLSGKSFIPLMIGMGCGVPGIMASRTIESEQDRRMTVMTTTFVPCGAKLPVIALIAGVIFGGAAWVATSIFFIGIASVLISGIILKKTRMFAGEPTPFVIELPAYHMPTVGAVLRSMWERGWSFIKKAGTIILLASVVIWFLSGFGFTDGAFGMVEDIDHSILATIGSSFAFIFAPLGFGFWEAAVASILGFVAKEEVVGVFGVLFGIGDAALDMVEEGAFSEMSAIAAAFGTGISAYSFLAFNMLCMPCFAAVGAMRREMNSGKWTAFAIAYQMVYAYIISLIIYQVGSLFLGGAFGVGSVFGLLALGFLIFMLARPKSAAQKLEAKTATRV